MNCKPGDLAIVVRAEGWGLAGRVSQKLLGAIVRVVRLAPPSERFQCTADLVWKFEEPIKVELDGKTYWADGIDDSCLRPIRDPGDDAQDEMLRPLPEPVEEVV